MGRKDVSKQIEALRRRRHNLRPRDVESIAEAAGWVYDRTEGSHAIYIKEGFWANLPIPQSKIKGNLGLRLLNLIEASIYEEEEE
jgi:predicted RNA binding protein YcfA (HicA-like mRNA interferase family)